MAASVCLVGCMLQEISPFDEDYEVVWDDREACDSTTIGCEVYEAPLVGQFECDGNDFSEFASSVSYFDACIWDGDTRQAAEMFPATSEASSSATSSSECLVGCMLQEISPFDEDYEVVWDGREACDSTTIGCE
ncbi:unnamed protein product, partial [Ectocarpus fasciculatus]